MKSAALIGGFMAGLVNAGALVFLWRHVQGTDSVVTVVAGFFAVWSILLPSLAYLFPSGKDYENLARERAEREANKDVGADDPNQIGEFWGNTESAFGDGW